MRKLKVALVGCGQIADAHLQEIRKIPVADVVAVCDRHPDLAEQAAARFEVPRTFEDLDQMLAEARPDVLHVTTPPTTHRAIALRALATGADVYIEKPFTLNAAEADEVLDAARAHGRRVCVGHDQLFDPVWQRVRQYIDSGRIGRVVHVDSVHGYDLTSPFGRAFVAEPDHWVHRLPGGLFQNVMSHALYRITEWLPDAEPEVRATAFAPVSGSETNTELRVMLRGTDVTANLIFSSTMRPVQRIARICGTKAWLEVDLDGRTIRLNRALSAPGAFAKIQAPARHLREAAAALARSLVQFARGDIHYFAGMNRLFTLFYESILHEAPPPFVPDEIRRVSAIMDRIFRGAPETAGCRGGWKCRSVSIPASVWNAGTPGHGRRVR
jgi:predicted dehydrogenase